MDASATFTLVAAGLRDVAAEELREPISMLDGRRVTSVTITSDEYSLNSVSGIATFEDSDRCFFKFHVEEGEEANVGEYYRAHVLADAGVFIDVPLAAMTKPGCQLVLYRERANPRFADVCREREFAAGPAATLGSDLHEALWALEDNLGRCAVETLRISERNEGSRAAIHQLFWHRMVDQEATFPSARLHRWYTSRVEWPQLSTQLWILNGTEYRDTLNQIIERARVLLDPSRLGSGALVTAHGDDHAGNVWVDQGQDELRLTLFDPAFAGDDVPALLAFVKATFHNVFAHPHWLYHPSHVTDAHAAIHREGRREVVTCAPLSQLRLDILSGMIERCWIPLLSALAQRGWLPPGWRQTVRVALAMCPLLVTDLLADSRSEEVQRIGLAHVVMMGSEPVTGTDALTTALDQIEMAVSHP